MSEDKKVSPIGCAFILLILTIVVIGMLLSGCSGSIVPREKDLFDNNKKRSRTG